MRADSGRVREMRLAPTLVGALLAMGGLALLVSGVSAGVADPLAAMEVIATERGKEAPDFALPDPDGKRLALRDFRGKVVLLTFFTTW